MCDREVQHAQPDHEERALPARRAQALLGRRRGIRQGRQARQGRPGPKGDPGPAGAKGDTGAKGAKGAKGDKGDAGQSGSPDGAADVLAKLLTVDGPGSGLDADLLGGLPASGYQQRVTGTCAGGSYVREIDAGGSVMCEPVADSLEPPLQLDVTDPAHKAISITLPGTSGNRGIDVLHNGVGPGVFAASTGGTGVWGTSNSVGGAALLGDNPWGEVVVGRQSGSGCETLFSKCQGIGAVVGRHDGVNGIGVRGFVTDPNGGTGVLGQSGISGGIGVAVRGENVNAANPDPAMEAITNAASGTALVVQNTAAVAVKQAASFTGNVTINGDLTVTGAKNGFRIDDPRAPDQRTLTHTPVETDALTVTYSGNVRTGADGRAVVRLPDYAETLAGDWRYGLTPIGRFGQAIIEREVPAGRFVVRTEHPRTKVSWTVTGTRHDPHAQQHAIEPVTDKGDDRGRYLEPALYGRPASRAIDELAAPTAASRAKLPSGR